MRHTRIAVASALIGLAFGGRVGAQALTPVPLPAPQLDGGKPLMEALRLRSTSRAFASDALPQQTLSNLLWAANGVNRPDGKRTAPSAHDWREIDIVVLLPAGAYVYDAPRNALLPLVARDLRPLGAVQDFAKTAPVTLVFVADLARMTQGSREEKEQLAYADAAFVSQNVYLYCASEGLATGVRAWVSRAALAKALELRENRLVLLAQSVGYPKQ